MEPAVNDLDLSAIDLVVDDRDPQATFDAALALLETLAPGARPRNGSVEAILLESIATANADTIYALNRVITLVVEGILGLYGIPRYAGASASGVVTLTLDGSRTLTVTAGQRLSEPSTGLVLLVTTTTSVTSATSIALPVHTEEPGGAGNAITVGTSIDLLDAIPYAVSAAVTTALTGGSDAESDTSYVDRASTVLARVTSSLVLPIHFIAYCLEDPRVNRATAIDLYEPGGTIGADTGHLTVYTYGYSAQLSAEIREELRAAMHEISASMVTVHVEPATLVTQAVTCEVTALAGYDPGDLETTITAALTAWMTPNSWTWGDDVRQTDIIALLADIPGVDFVDAVTVPSGTTALAADELATIGTITVTVN
ncbi:MAG: hypothetical protein QG661_2698 [Actinomycetota bacterium]|nr:hypothetical protein [Actinomycetota bacterium]